MDLLFDEKCLQCASFHQELFKQAALSDSKIDEYKLKLAREEEKYQKLLELYYEVNSELAKKELKELGQDVAI